MAGVVIVLSIIIYHVLDNFTEATEFVKAVEKRTGLKIACLEEIAINYKWVTKEAIANAIKNFKGGYFDYLKKIIEE